MRLAILPQLMADQGIKRDVPGSEVQVRVRIYSPTVLRKDATEAEPVSVLVKLASAHAAVADLAPDQPATVRTDHQGYATWKVRIRAPGVAPFSASADGFESVTIDMVGMPRPAPTFRDAELRAAQEQAAVLDTKARAAEAGAEDLEVSLAQVKAQSDAQKVAVLEQQQKGAPTEAMRTRTYEIELRYRNLVSNAQNARVEADRAKKDAFDSLATAQLLAAQLPGLQPRTISEAELKPGDIFLVLGSAPLLSTAITKFESGQLGTEALYSHASLFLGQVDGRNMVAEMWSSGFWITPLAVSTKGARIVDVYRWQALDDRKRQAIVDRAVNLFGPHARFTRDDDPSMLSRGSLLPYAFEEILALGTAATSPFDVVLQTMVKNIVDPLAGGRRKMICSELVAWVYSDVGLEIPVTYWRRFNDAGLLTTNDRRKDYTTPNMLAQSSSLTRVGRYLGP